MPRKRQGNIADWVEAMDKIMAAVDARETAIRKDGADSDESLLRIIEKLQVRVKFAEGCLDEYPRELLDRRRDIDSLERRCQRLEKRVGIASPPTVESILEHPERPGVLEQQMLEMIRSGQAAGRGDSFAGRTARSERALALVDWFLDQKGADDQMFTLGYIKNEIRIRGLNKA